MLLGEAGDGPGGIVALYLVPAGADVGGQLRSFSIAGRSAGRVASLAATWTTSSSPLSRDAIRAARRMQGVGPGDRP